MAKTVLRNAYFSINGVNLSDHVHTQNQKMGADAVEQTAMGDTTHNFMPGLLTADFSVEFFQDEASNEVEATLSAILAGGVAVAIETRPVNTTVSATNPKWTGNVMLESFDVIKGTVGQAHMCQA